MVENSKTGSISLNPVLVASLEKNGYLPFTAIQTATIPLLLEGREFYALSPTGTGKTAAFLVPVIEKILSNKRFTLVVLEPSRELVIQTANECRKIAEGLGVTVVAAYGGTPPKRQEELLQKGANVIVGTPERLVELTSKNLAVKPDLLILDEADRLLGHQFTKDITRLAFTYRGTRMNLFSVQMPKALLEKAERLFVKQFDTVKTGTVAGKTVTHSYVVSKTINEKLAELLKAKPDVPSIVFCATAKQVNEVGFFLKYHGLRLITLHADKGAQRRHNAIRRFKHGETLLIGTDLAARGVHFEGVKIIYSLGVPPNPDFYIHRAGRTGRMYSAGECISIIQEHDVKRLKNIYASLGITPNVLTSTQSSTSVNHPKP